MDMDDLSMMQEPERWPCYPFLPLKRYKGHQPEFGFMTDELEPTVYKGNLFDAESRRKLEVLKFYTTHQELLQDGWIVD